MRELVSSDFIGNSHSSIFDATQTKLLGDRFGKVFSWYDNDWGFSNRMVDLVQLIAQKGRAPCAREAWLEEGNWKLHQRAVPVIRAALRRGSSSLVRAPGSA